MKLKKMGLFRSVPNRYFAGKAKEAENAGGDSGESSPFLSEDVLFTLSYGWGEENPETGQLVMADVYKHTVSFGPYSEELGISGTTLKFTILLPTDMPFIPANLATIGSDYIFTNMYVKLSGIWINEQGDRSCYNLIDFDFVLNGSNEKAVGVAYNDLTSGAHGGNWNYSVLTEQVNIATVEGEDIENCKLTDEVELIYKAK